MAFLCLWRPLFIFVVNMVKGRSSKRGNMPKAIKKTTGGHNDVVLGVAAKQSMAIGPIGIRGIQVVMGMEK
jgi:hypothetical protein